MREYSSISIGRAVFHVVEPKKGRLVLSAGEATLAKPYKAFLASHVASGLADSQGKAANFVVPGNDRVSGLCERLLGARPNVVPLSQSVAQRLYEASLGDE